MNSSACSGGGNNRWQKKVWRAGRWAGFFALGGILASCQAASLHTSVFQRDYRPDNVFAYPSKLSLDFRRVAVLPLAAAADAGDLAAGCDALTPVLGEQLLKTKRFEVVNVDAEGLRRHTGRATWRAGEVLPADFLAYLRREYDCDGVLFAELTTYHAYAPLVVGWRFKLVDARSGEILWAADEVFDAGHSEVARAARHFEKKPALLDFSGDDGWAVLNSPRQFGGYSASALLDTLPQQ
jgi:hypothetical protein